MDAPYTAFPNQFRRDVIAGRRLIGCWSVLASPITTEILGLAGFDWLVLDGEHAPNDIGTFIPQLMALKDSASAPVVRPPENDPVVIKRLLDTGFHNFVIPMVESADEARSAVAATRYPPAGIRGVASVQRNNRYGTVPDYFEVVNDNICVVVQIESVPGLAAIEEICAVDGVDGLLIGPSDLAAGMGHLGNPGHDAVQAAIRDGFARIRACGRSAGTLAVVEADARRYMEWGASFIAVGVDQGLFRNATRGLRERFRDPGPAG